MPYGGGLVKSLGDPPDGLRVACGAFPEDPAEPVDLAGPRPADQRPPGWRQVDDDPALVSAVGAPDDQAVPFEAADELGHGGLGHALAERGADVNGRRGDGMTALHAACWRGLAQVVQELLDAGADPAVTAAAGPHQGQAPADTALAQGYLLLAARLDVPGHAVSSPYE